MKIADYKKPSDWELFFKHRTNYIPLKILEQKYKLSIDKFLFSRSSKVFLPTFPVAPTIAIFMI